MFLFKFYRWTRHTLENMAPKAKVNPRHRSQALNWQTTGKWTTGTVSPSIPRRMTLLSSRTMPTSITLLHAGWDNSINLPRGDDQINDTIQNNEKVFLFICVLLLLFSVDHVEYYEANGGGDTHAGNETHGNKQPKRNRPQFICVIKTSIKFLFSLI